MEMADPRISPIIDQSWQGLMNPVANESAGLRDPRHLHHTSVIFIFCQDLSLRRISSFSLLLGLPSLSTNSRPIQTFSLSQLNRSNSSNRSNLKKCLLVSLTPPPSVPARPEPRRTKPVLRSSLRSEPSVKLPRQQSRILKPERQPSTVSLSLLLLLLPLRVANLLPTREILRINKFSWMGSKGWCATP